MILAGDVGGTKTLLAVYEKIEGKLTLRESKKYESIEFENFEEVLQLFCNEYKVSPAAACFGVPGPVIDGCVKTTNLPWEFSESQIAEKVGIPKVKLVNDLVSTSAAIPLLTEEDLVLLYPGNEPREKRVFAIVAPGTGMGQATLIKEGEQEIILPSEGGHVDFAPRNSTEMQLLSFLLKKLRRVSVERIVCGPGLLNIYQFLKHSKYAPESKQVANRFLEEDPSKVISDAALTQADALCIRALEIFVSALGSHAGNLVLTNLATGGVFLGGGIPPKILPALQTGALVQSYLTKGRLSPLVEATPLYVIKDDKASLRGAASIASKL